MTRKDYILIAAALKEAQPGFTTIAENGITNERKRGYFLAVTAICAALARDNPRFDRERFLKAAGVQS